MLYRPVDSEGDILPIVTPGDLVRDAKAVAQLIYDRLELLYGTWWEDPEWGNEILEMMRESRITEADGDALAAYITSYIMETPGVVDVSEIDYSVADRRFSYSCLAETESGSEIIEYEAE